MRKISRCIVSPCRLLPSLPPFLPPHLSLSLSLPPSPLSLSLSLSSQLSLILSFLPLPPAPSPIPIPLLPSSSSSSSSSFVSFLVQFPSLSYIVCALAVSMIEFDGGASSVTHVCLHTVSCSWFSQWQRLKEKFSPIKFYPVTVYHLLGEVFLWNYR